MPPEILFPKAFELAAAPGSSLYVGAAIASPSCPLRSLVRVWVGMRKIVIVLIFMAIACFFVCIYLLDYEKVLDIFDVNIIHDKWTAYVNIC